MLKEALLHIVLYQAKNGTTQRFANVPYNEHTHRMKRVEALAATRFFTQFALDLRGLNSH